MKNLLFLGTLLFVLNLSAQNTEGTIYFTETVKFEVKLPEGQEHLLAMIPSSNSQTKALYFTADRSLYKDLDVSDDATEINNESDGQEVQIHVITASSENHLLKDFSLNKFIDQRDFLGKIFLIKGDIQKIQWKVTGKQKKILDYVCQEAVLQDTSQSTTAWFTPQIPLSNGPDVHGQLPGMILEVSMDDGRRTIIASKVELGILSENTIITPKKGKKVTREEFQKIQEEKRKEMGGGNGHTVIKMEIRN